MSIVKIQAELKAPKNQRNKFGNYNYRSAEDIIEAVKPILHKYGSWLNISDEIVEVGGRVYVKAVATITQVNNHNGEVTMVSHSATGFAREEETKKGMDGAQITGAASSYARKYALNGLLAIDDTKDADATNKHEAEEPTYIKLHESLEDLEIAIDSCENKNELERLYNLNKNSIGNDKNIIQLFANKKKSL